MSIIMLSCAAILSAQEAVTEDLPSVRNKVYKGYYYFRTEDSDSTLMLVLNPITCFPDEVFKNKKQEQFY